MSRTDIPDPIYAILHVTSHGESRYLLMDAPAVFPEVAEGLRRYLGMNREDKPASFDLYYTGFPLTPDEFNEHISDFLNLRSDAAGVYDVNLDAGNFCVLRAGCATRRGWQAMS